MNQTTVNTNTWERLGRPSLESETRLYRKVAWRLLPLLLICYLVAYLDRINVGFAKLQMQDALGFGDAVYGLGAGIFFLGYFLFEVPSNMLLKRIGARKTLTRIMVCWGITGCCMAYVTTPMQFYVARFLLGVFEAGFFPGVVYFLGCWFPQARRGKMLGLFMTGFPIAGMLGGPISGWAMTHLAGVAGIAGWQWLFVVTSLPAVLLGLVVFATLDDDFEHARWLSEPERVILRTELKAERARSVHAGTGALWDVLRDRKVYVMTFAYFTFICGTYALSFWLPTVLKSAGISSVEEIGWISAIPFGLSALGMVIICRSSDLRFERRWHAVVAGVAGAIALSLLPVVGHNLTVTVALLTVASTGIFVTLPLFWALATDYFSGSASAAEAIAIVNSLGLLGGFVSPFAMGWMKSMTGTLDSGLYLVTGLLLVGSVSLVLGIPAYAKRIGSR